MKVHEYGNGDPKRMVLKGMMVDQSILGRIASKWTPGGLFGDNDAASNALGRMCVDYYRSYGKPPGEMILELVAAFENESQDRATAKMTKELAETCWGINNTDGNPAYIIDVAGKLFEKIKLDKTLSVSRGLLESGKVEDAVQKIQEHGQVGLTVSSGIDWFNDKEAVLAAFSPKQHEVLVKYTGALGKFLGSTFKKSQFVSFMAPEKSMKSFFLLDAAYRAFTQRRRVAYIQAGDMSEDDVIARLATRTARHPHESQDDNWPYTFNIPTGIEPPFEEGVGKIALPSFKSVTFDKGLTGQQAWDSFQEVQAESIRSNKCYFKMSVVPNNTLSVADLDSQLASWETSEGWIPDVVVIDYADLIRTVGGNRLDRRDQINDVWSALRTLASKRRCCLVTATQANRKSYDGWMLKPTHVSEDKRKLGHIATMIGINVTDDERDMGMCRLNIFSRRHKKFNPSIFCYVAGCLDICHPAMRSTMFKKEANDA